MKLNLRVMSQDSLRYHGSPILEKAQQVLGRRLNISNNDTVYIDGRRASIREAVMQANMKLQKTGCGLLRYPGVLPHHLREKPINICCPNSRKVFYK